MAAKPKPISEPERFFNRELSWLEFNRRVLEEAMNPQAPLLERVKFFCIFSSNLDEFFEVRVAGLKQQMESGGAERSLDGRTPAQTFKAVTRTVRQLLERQSRFYHEALLPELQKRGFRFCRMEELSLAEKAFAAGFYQRQVRPVLTPLALDPAHPFPQLMNKSLNFIVQLEVRQQGQTQRRLAVVQVPRVLPRLVLLPGSAGGRKYLFLARLIGEYMGDLFPGTRILGHWSFRVTRNSELYIDEEESASLLKAVENELHNRRKGDAVRLELERDCPASIQEFLLETQRLQEEDLYVIDGPLNPTRLMALCEGDHSPELRDPPHVAPVARSFREATDLFSAIRERDQLLHHPYESFDTVLKFLEQAAEDPAVLAIKQTLYRTGGDPRVVGALMNAVRNGKQVTAVVELRARFDEANNILWARTLEEAGVHVVYGLVDYKIHAKICLVVRREAEAIRRYVHLSTGNYNPTTARMYTDLGFFTCDDDFGEDATNLFNLLTGICQFQGSRRLIVSPFDLDRRLRELIARESANAARGLPARIIAKMNALADPVLIEALYQASQSGVRVDLLVRGICCLRPGVKGLSERISVRSLVDRFLEHSRIWYFENGCQPELFLTSADWMPRNLHRRIELAWPVRDGNLRERLAGEILELALQDTSKARVLTPSGTYRPVPAKRGTPARRSQEQLMQLALGERVSRPGKNRPGRYPAVRLARRPVAGEKQNHR